MYTQLLGKSEDESPDTSILSDDRKKLFTNTLRDIIEDEYTALQDYAEEYISDASARRAESFLERILKGDEDAFIALIGGGYNSRYRAMGYDKGKPWASLIHGSLFEPGAMATRRKIVEAHRDLLVSERIADLESVVQGLTSQIKELTKQIESAQNNY